MVAAFAARGATVHVPDKSVRLDDEAATVAYYAALPALYASIHVVGGFAMAPLADTTLADFEAQWRINTLTCFLACREAVRAIRKTGGGGRIVNVASRAAVSPAANMTAYIASISKGDVPYGSLAHRALFAVGSTLFVMTLAMNLLSVRMSRRVRRRSAA